MKPPVIGVLALQGDVPEHLRALEAAGAKAVPVRRPEELERIEGLVIPGGESTTLWRLSVAFDVLEPLRKLIEAGLPTFGSCAGMIMLADRLADGVPSQQTYGGIDMTVRRNAFGRQVDSFESDIFLTGLDRDTAEGTPLHAVFIRAPWVEQVGDGVCVLGTDEGTGRIVAVRQGPLLATAFHPELTPDRRIHELFVDIVKGLLMSGHSKWATTKHKKAVVDAKRGKLFAKLIKNVEVAARTGGGDLAGNPTLYDAIQKAKKSSVPNDNIDRAVRRGSGLEAGGAQYENITYEGYGPGGVAVLVECLTDNRNRAASDVRTAFTRNGGSMADPGSVSYLFHRKGVIVVEKKGVTEDDVLGAVLDSGAEEVNDLGESFEVVSEPADLITARTALQDAGIDYDSADVAFLPSVEIDLDEEQAKRVFRLIDALEDSDDVQDVYANYSVSDDIMEKLG
jgi:pyridoxal 5'-phosphate synthase glutaminase subunit Pdx2